MRKCLVLMLVISGCCKVPPYNLGEIKCTTEQRINQQLLHPETDAITCNLLEEPLTPQSAVQIALLNSPVLKSQFEEVGIVHADLVEAGLMSNPFFAGSARFPNIKNKSTDWELAGASVILDLFLIPLRKKVATIRYDQIKLTISHAVLHLAKEVSQLFYQLQAQMLKQDLLFSFYSAECVAYEVARDQYLAGTINALTLNEYLTKATQAKAEYDQQNTFLIHLKEELSALMGLSHSCWDVCKTSYPLPESELSCSNLEEIAQANRLDLQAAYLEMCALSKMIDTKQWWSYTNVELGVAAEREPENFWIVGPAWGLSIPLFNFGQAARARLFAMQRQSFQDYQALKISIFAQVREAMNSTLTMREVVNHYETDLLPSYATLIETAQTHYNVMGIGVYQMLDYKKQELLAQMNYVVALRDYWIAKRELSFAIGEVLCAN